MAKDKVSRREFFKRTALATGAAVVGSQLVTGVNAAKTISKAPAVLPVSDFGKIGEKMPTLAYGGAGLPRQWGSPYSDADRIKLLHTALDWGVKYFDTSVEYFESQSLIGEAFKDRRKRVFLATKVDTTNPKYVRWEFDKCLKELQTDYIDLIQIHGSPGIQNMSVERAFEILAELEKIKAEGKVRFIGLTGHSYYDKLLALIESDKFDQCLLGYGYFGRGYDQVLSPKMLALREKCIAKADELGMGIVAMKVLSAGFAGQTAPYVSPGMSKDEYARLPGAAIRYIQKDKRVHLLNIGIRTFEDLENDINIISSEGVYTDDDETLLAQFSKKVWQSDAVKRLKLE